MREWILAALLAAACGLVTVGAALLATPAGFIVGGILLGVWAVLTFVEVPDRSGP